MKVFRYQKFVIRLTCIHLLKCIIINKTYENRKCLYWVRLIESKEPYVRGERFLVKTTDLIKYNGQNSKNNKT